MADTPEQLEIKRQRLAQLQQQYKDYAAEAAKAADGEKILGEEMEELRKKIDQLTEELNEHTDALKDAREGYDGLVGVGKNLITSLTGISDGYKKTGVGLLMAKDGAKAFGKALEETLTPANILGSFLKGAVEQTLELSIATDKAMVSFATSTGMQEEYSKSIIENEKALRYNGITVGDVSAATADLISNYRGFTELSSGTRDQVVQLSATLEKAGVDMGAMAGSMDTLTAAMGLGEGQAVQLQMNMYALGKEIGIGGPAAVAEFGAASSRLAKFGGNMAETFADLARTAKAARMSISDVLDITEKFDRFDSAAASVGQLNAILGGPFLNSMEMVMTTDPSARLRMLSDAARAGGRSFADLTYYERQFMASAMGLKDTAELSKLMAGELDGLTGGMREQSMTQEELNELTTDFNSLADEFKQTMMLLAVQMEPVVKLLKKFHDFMQDNGKAVGNVATVILSLVAATKLYSLALATFQMFAGPVSGIMGLMGKTTKKAGDDVDKAGPKFARGAIGVGQFGIALMTITVPIALIVAGLAGIAFGVAAVINGIAKLAEIFGSLGKASFGVAALAMAIRDIPLAKMVGLTALMTASTAFNTSAAMTAAAVGFAAGRRGGEPARSESVKVSLEGVVLKVNDRELGRFVEETVEGKIVPVRAIGA